MDMNFVLLAILIVAALYTVLAGTLLLSAIGLALTSVALTLVMFHLNSPLAAMFELSVCAGLITAIFISAISLIKPLTAEEIARNKKSRLKRYAFLLIIIAIVAIAMQYVKTPSIGALFAPIEFDVRRMIWHVRQLDLIGQLVILLVGIFAIRILYMHKDKASHGE